MEEKKLLDPFQMLKLIECLRNAYAQTKYQDPGDFLSGDCYYFAVILKELLPECIICNNAGHYFVYYNKFYYDVSGIYTPKEPIKISDKASDQEMDLLFAELHGCISNLKDVKFNHYAPILLKAGYEFLENLNNELMNTKISR